MPILICTGVKISSSKFDIVPFIDFRKFNIKYLIMHKVQMHAGAIIKQGIVWFYVCTSDNPFAFKSS